MNIVRLTAIYITLMGWAAMAWAEDASSDMANHVKAAYLLKFASYVEWPVSSFPQDSTPVTIGIIGSDQIAMALGKLSINNLVNNRVVRVKQLKTGEPITGVQVLFIGWQEQERLKQCLDDIQSQPILTVSERKGALSVGSVINFLSEDDRIRFEVSVSSAERNGLKISARLLGVAQKVEGRRP